jgi:hypothetical protein
MANVRFADKVREQIHDAGRCNYVGFNRGFQYLMKLEIVSKGAKTLIDTGKLFAADKVRVLTDFKNRTQQKERC